MRIFRRGAATGSRCTRTRTRCRSRCRPFRLPAGASGTRPPAGTTFLLRSLQQSTSSILQARQAHGHASGTIVLMLYEARKRLQQAHMLNLPMLNKFDTVV